MAPKDLLIPVKKLTKRPGLFRWPKRTVLASARTADLMPFGQLARDLRASGVFARVAQSAAAPAAVRIRRHGSAGGPEAYRLTVSAGGVEIVASADAGAYYAVQTLRDLLTLHGRSIPACEIEDAPAFSRRGVYHDCSRGKVPKVEPLKGLIEQLARWKINELQLYVENVFTFRRHPAIGRGYSPFTPQDILELQEHCKLHHVRPVPSLATFGHMEKILALPEYRHLGEMYGCGGSGPGSTLCPGDPGSIRLVEDMCDEFVPLFEPDDFNTCDDETWELGKGRSKRRADKVGVGRLYLQFLLKVHRVCQKHGKRMNAWSDIVLQHPELLAHLPKDIVMLNWDYAVKGGRIPRTNEIAEAGLPLVICPGTNSWGSHGCRLEMGMKNITVFTAEGAKHGAEGVLNTNWGDGGNRNMLAVALHNFAWGAAESWQPGKARPAGFTEAFCLHTFGQAAKTMAAAIRTLGGARRALRHSDSNGSLFYGVFLAPMADLAGEGNRSNQLLAATRAEDLAAHRSALSNLRWPGAARGRSRFEAAIFQEYALATRMDMLSARKALIAKKLLAGRTIPAAEWKDLARETDRTAAELKRVWALQNRPSRLRYQLSALRKCAAESKKAASRHGR